MKTLRILVSNIDLPSKGIGSWTKMFDHFNEKDDFFDFILSPGAPSGRFIYCKKRRWITYYKSFRNFLLIHWVAKDFLFEITKLSQNCDLIKVVIEDDIALTEAISLRKSHFSCKVEVIFHFHGFHLNMSKKVDELVDKVLFLSNSSYQYTLKSNLQFTPEAFVIGNFVLNTKFYPAKVEEKKLLKKSLDIPNDSLVIVWMANDRRVKGLHLFEKISNILLNSFPDLLIFVIGTSIKYENNNNRLRYLGRIEHDLIPNYLKVSDFYFFPSLVKEGFGLSVVEALYCGNWIISTSNGSLFEVLDKFPNVFFVEEPNVIENWINLFNVAYRLFLSNKLNADKQIVNEYSYEKWAIKFKNSIG